MSYLNRPRLHFSGKVVVRTATANNVTRDRNNRVYFDVAGVRLDLPQDADQFREFLHRRNIDGYVNALWNYYGDNSIRFSGVNIHAVEMESGPAISDPALDGCIGSAVNIAGDLYGDVRTSAYLVDTDPTDAFTTQLLSDVVSLTRDGAPILEATGAQRSYSRWLNYWRNLAVDGDDGSSAYWYLALPNDGLSWSEVPNSPALNALREAASRQRGLAMRFCTYMFRHLPYREIARRFQEGNFDPVEGVLLVVGTLGVWGENDLGSAPACRVLQPNIANPIAIPDAIRSRRQGESFFLGTALAQVDTERRIITLDLASSFPEIAAYDVLNPTIGIEDSPEKLDLGDLSLWVEENCAPETRQKIADLPMKPGQADAAYGKEAYLRTAGIVELPYPAELEDLILRGDLVLLQTEDAPPLLQENPYQALTDSRGVYLELEDQRAIPVPIHVLVRGEPAPPGLKFSLSQTVNRDRNSTDAPGDSVEPTSGVTLASHSAAESEIMVPHTRFRIFRRPGPAEEVMQLPIALTTGPNGIAMLNLRPRKAGLGKIWFNFPTDPHLESVSGSRERYFLQGGIGHYLNFRVLPDDRHYDQVPDAELTWPFMYREVFSFYALIYPAMNRYINFEDEAAVRAHAALIRNFISARVLESTLYMPVTRELSAGKRRLIQRWAALVE